MARTSPTPRAAVLAVRVVKLVAAALLVVGVLVVGLGRTGTGGDAERPGAAADQRSTDQRLAACSQHRAVRPAQAARALAAGAGDDVAAVVRRPGGRVVTVPFEEGWQVYQGRSPGTLVAVCRAAASAGAR